MAEPSDLTRFLESAGRSLGDAQGSLVGTASGVPTTVAISDAELEIKTLFETQAGGGLAVRPVSGKDALTGRIAPEALSTVTIRYVAVADDPTPVRASRPDRTAEAVADEVRGRKDVAVLDQILGGLSIEAAFVPSTRRWLVTVADQSGQIVREVVVSDLPPETSKED